MKQTFILAAVAVAGIVCGNVFAADIDKLATTTSTKGDEPGIYYSGGENAEGLARAAKTGVTTYEDAAKEGGDGAPQKTLIDNEVVKVNLVAYKKGFMRPGSLKRRYNTLLIYVDPGRFTIVKGGTGAPIANPVPQKLAPGSSVFHYKDTIVTENRIDEDYRVLYVMMKR